MPAVLRAADPRPHCPPRGATAAGCNRRDDCVGIKAEQVPVSAAPDEMPRKAMADRAWG